MSEAAMLICSSQYASSYFKPGRRTIILPTHVDLKNGDALGLAGSSRIIEGVVMADLVRHTTQDQITDSEAREWGCADPDAARSLLRAAHGSQISAAEGKVTIIHFSVVKQIALVEPYARGLRWG